MEVSAQWRWKKPADGRPIGSPSGPLSRNEFIIPATDFAGKPLAAPFQVGFVVVQAPHPLTRHAALSWLPKAFRETRREQLWSEKVTP
jgi:hypothetical protein